MPKLEPSDPKGLKPWQAAGIGVVLFIVSCLLCFLNPFFFLVGLVTAIITLFIKGARCIFVGYILTVGVLLLVAIVYCSTHPFRID